MIARRIFYTASGPEPEKCKFWPTLCRNCTNKPLEEHYRTWQGTQLCWQSTFKVQIPSQSAMKSFLKTPVRHFERSVTSGKPWSQASGRSAALNITCSHQLIKSTQSVVMNGWMLFLDSYFSTTRITVHFWAVDSKYSNPTFTARSYDIQKVHHGQNDVLGILILNLWLNPKAQKFHPCFLKLCHSLAY